MRKTFMTFPVSPDCHAFYGGLVMPAVIPAYAGRASISRIWTPAFAGAACAPLSGVTALAPTWRSLARRGRLRASHFRSFASLRVTRAAK